MKGSSSLGRWGMGRRAACTLGWAVVGVVVLGGVACLPDRELASYAAGRAAASDSVASAATPAPAPSAVDPLEAAAEGPTLDSSRDAGGATREEVPSPPEPDATPAPTLACRTDCECERRGEREFMFCSESVSFADAEERCVDAGGTLASIDDAAL